MRKMIFNLKIVRILADLLRCAKVVMFREEKR